MNTYTSKLKIPDDVLCTVLIEKLDMQACSKVKASLYGAICAAGLKAAAASKQLRNNSEHFAIVTLVDCRHYLEPVVSDSTVGLYLYIYNLTISLSVCNLFDNIVVLLTLIHESLLVTFGLNSKRVSIPCNYISGRFLPLCSHEHIPFE